LVPLLHSAISNRLETQKRWGSSNFSLAKRKYLAINCLFAFKLERDVLSLQDCCCLLSDGAGSSQTVRLLLLPLLLLLQDTLQQAMGWLTKLTSFTVLTM
jgi:hypothetical protein